MDAITTQIRALAEAADEAGRQSILNALQTLQYQLEPPNDIFMKLYNSHIQLAVVAVAVDLGLFKELTAKAPSALTADDLVATSKASPALLERVLRYLSSMSFIANPNPGQFQANKTTHILASPVADAGVIHAFDTCGPPLLAFPSFLAETKYQDFAQDNQTPFQKGHNTELGAFQWLSQRPKNFNALQQVMTAMQSADWLESLDVLDQAARAIEQGPPQASEAPFFVDVGGGHGHQCRQLLAKYPSLHDRLVLQDLPQAVDKLPPIDGVKAVAQDFFQEQSIKGTSPSIHTSPVLTPRVSIIYPSLTDLNVDRVFSSPQAQGSTTSAASCTTGRTPSVCRSCRGSPPPWTATAPRASCSTRSSLPDANAPWQAAMADISMGVLFGAKERTRRQWEVLVARSGLKLVGMRTYSVSSCNSIIVLEKA